MNLNITGVNITNISYAYFGNNSVDTYLYRSAASVLTLNSHLIASGGWVNSTSINVTNIYLSDDVQLLRGAANRLDLASGDSFNLVSGAISIGGTNVIDSSRNVIASTWSNGTNFNVTNIYVSDDTQLLRGAANRLDLASGDSFNLVSGSLLIGGLTTIDSNRNINGTWLNATNLNASISLYAQSITEGGTTLPNKYVSRTDWTTIDNYPTGCSAGQYATAVGDTLTCAFAVGVNNMTGFGIVGYIPQWFNGTALNNSNIFQLGNNVGIGTTSPGNYKLNVIGDINASWGNFTNVNISSTFNAPNVVSAGGWVNTSNLNVTNNAYIGGSIGIGTTGPADKLTIKDGDLRLYRTHVAGDTITWSQNITFTDEADRVGAKIQGIRTAWDGAPIALTFYTGGVNIITEQMRITSAGNVGIGTTTPLTLLEISANNTNIGALTEVLTIDHFISNATNGTANIASGILFRSEDTLGNIENISLIAANMTTATNGSEASSLNFYIASGGNNGVSLTESMRLVNGGIISSNWVNATNINASTALYAQSITEGGTALSSKYTPQTRTLTAGSGLTGGGDLSADRTFTVSAGGGLTVDATADTINLSSTAAGTGLAFSSGVLSVNTASGLTTSGDDVILDSAAAGTGLAYATGVLSVNTGNGLTTSGDNIVIDTATVPQLGDAETITGAWTFDGNVRINSNLQVAGNITYVNSQTINVNGSMVPPIDNTFDLGNATLRWRDINGTRLFQGANQAVDTLSATADETTVSKSGGTVTIGIADPLIVAKGGTGAASLTDGGILLGSGTGAVTVTAQPTNGQLLIGSTGADPVLATLTGTTNQITVTNGAGSITLSTPQDIATGSTPTFAGLITTGNIHARGATVNATHLNASNWINGTNLNASTALYAQSITEAGTTLPNKYVSRTDWTTIDNYPTGCSEGQSIRVIGDTLTCVSTVSVNNMTGFGIAGYIPQWFNGTALNNSNIFQLGNNVGIGTTSPGNYKLNVIGDINASWGNFTNLNATNAIYATNGTFYGTFLQTISSSPTIVGNITGTSLDGPTALYVSGKYAYVTSYSSDSLTIIDIAVPSSPTVVGSVSSSTQLDGPAAVYVTGKYAYVGAYSDSYNMFTVVDVSNPASPSIVGNVQDTMLKYTRGIYVTGKYAYVAGRDDNRTIIIDISNPASPSITGSIKNNTHLYDPITVKVSGQYAYVSLAAGDGLAILNVSNPASPAIAGNITGTQLDGAFDVYVSGKYAYVTANADNRLTIVNVSNVTNPTIVGSVQDATNLGAARYVYVSGKYAYVTVNTNSRFTVVDVSNPSSPFVVSSVADANKFSSPWHVRVSGKYAYVVAESSDMLTIIDIGGIDAPAASIGDISASSIEVTENVDIGNNLYVRNGINVGPGGIMSNGPVSFGNNSLITTPAGLVGIGTTAPSTNLQVASGTGQSDTYGYVQAYYTGTATNANSGFTAKNYQGTSQFMQWETYGLRIGSRILTNSGVGDVIITAGADSEKVRILASNGNVGIGDDSPDYLLELYDATNTPAFALSDDDIAHGVTTLAQTDVFGHLSSISTTVGGLQVTGLADATGIALGLKGVQSSDPTDTTPAISLIGTKASGTGVQDLGALETVLQIANNDDTAAITVLGSGSVGIGTTTPGNYKLNVIGDINASWGNFTNINISNSLYAPNVVSAGGWVNTSNLNVTNNAYIGGSIGIGTMAPGMKLEVIQSGDSIQIGSDGNANIEMRDKDGGIAYIDFSNDVSTDYDARISLRGDNSLAIEGTNVGIGTTTPVGKLEVKDTDLLLNLSQTRTVFNEDGADIDFRIEGDANANMFVVDAGNDMIGILAASSGWSRMRIGGVSRNLPSGGHPDVNGELLQISGDTVTDTATAASGTAGTFRSVVIMNPTLAATNAGVTTTNAATLYIGGPVTAGSQMTLTNAYALWVDDGTARFDNWVNTTYLNVSSGFIVTPQGNVGIGTASPVSKLQINYTDAGSNQYIQLPVNITALAATDCDSPSEWGRMIVDNQTANLRIHFCVNNGWRFINFDGTSN